MQKVEENNPQFVTVSITRESQAIKKMFLPKKWDVVETDCFGIKFQSIVVASKNNTFTVRKLKPYRFKFFNWLWMLWLRIKYLKS